MNGYLLDNNGPEGVFDLGFVYSTTNVIPNIQDDSSLSGGGGIGSYSNTIIMVSDVTYYIRAYATNSIGTSYGETITVNDQSIPIELSDFDAIQSENNAILLTWTTKSEPNRF